MHLNNCFFRFTFFDGEYFDVRYIDDDLFIDVSLTTLCIENIIKFWLRGFISLSNNILYELSLHYGLYCSGLRDLKAYAHSVRFDDTDLTDRYFKVEIIYVD